MCCQLHQTDLIFFSPEPIFDLCFSPGVYNTLELILVALLSNGTKVLKEFNPALVWKWLFPHDGHDIMEQMLHWSFVALQVEQGGKQEQHSFTDVS